MLEMSCGLPWLVSVPSLSRMICGCCAEGGTAAEVGACSSRAMPACGRQARGGGGGKVRRVGGGAPARPIPPCLQRQRASPPCWRAAGGGRPNGRSTQESKAREGLISGCGGLAVDWQACRD